MTNTEISNQIKETNKDIDSIKKQIEPFKTGGRKLITEAELKKAETNLLKLRQEWKKRKRGCMDVCDVFSEMAEMNKKKFIETVGLETDEENKAVNPL